MSRVRKPGDKWMNVPRHPPEFYEISPPIYSKASVVHPEKATTLRSWLFVKYDMSYNTFTRKSKVRKDALRKEYEKETGRKIKHPESCQQ